MKSIKNFENYLLLEDGSIINNRTGRELKHQKNQKGYSQIQLSNKSIVKNFRIHQLVYTHYIGNIKKGFEINHIDGNKNNNHYSNLELVTRKENMKKAVELGFIKKGEDCINSVPVIQLNPITREKISEFGSINIASKETGISQSSISLASRGYRYSAGGFLWELKNK